MAVIRSEQLGPKEGLHLSTENILTLIGIIAMFLIPIICFGLKCFIFPRSEFHSEYLSGA
jgi:hypothetical protein